MGERISSMPSQGLQTRNARFYLPSPYFGHESSTLLWASALNPRPSAKSRSSRSATRRDRAAPQRRPQAPRRPQSLQSATRQSAQRAIHSLDTRADRVSSQTTAHSANCSAETESPMDKAVNAVS